MTDASSSSASAIDQAPATTLVTVTYADRIGYLSELLDRAFTAEGVGRAVVVSNASKSNLNLLERQWGDRVHVVRLDSNTGSANGYATGIQTALDDGAGYIWLMDDDNAPKSGALSVLHRELASQILETGTKHAAVLGFRPEHQADIASGICARQALPPRSSFFGFHYRQILFKIWRRIKPAQKSVSAIPRNIVSLAYAPYGGLLANRELFKRIGLPKRELVLYADDTEYTRRITADGGFIQLITEAELEDMEGSWNLKHRHTNSLIGWLKGNSDFRAFYASRNQAWFDKHVWATSKLEYRINHVLFLGLLVYFAIRTRSTNRLHLLLRAIRNGQSSRLGIDSEFPLV